MLDSINANVQNVISETVTKVKIRFQYLGLLLGNLCFRHGQRHIHLQYADIYTYMYADNYTYVCTYTYADI